jgi:predicted neutral ceramidase superfamily lipid hydrolase
LVLAVVVGLVGALVYWIRHKKGKPASVLPYWQTSYITLARIIYLTMFFHAAGQSH